MEACPKCGGVMVLRQNRNTGEEFWGCTAFPECRGTREKKEEEDYEGLTPSERARKNDQRRWKS